MLQAVLNILLIFAFQVHGTQWYGYTVFEKQSARWAAAGIMYPLTPDVLQRSQRSGTFGKTKWRNEGKRKCGIVVNAQFEKVDELYDAVFLRKSYILMKQNMDWMQCMEYLLVMQSHRFCGRCYSTSGEIATVRIKYAFIFQLFILDIACSLQKNSSLWMRNTWTRTGMHDWMASSTARTQCDVMCDYTKSTRTWHIQ